MTKIPDYYVRKFLNLPKNQSHARVIADIKRDSNSWHGTLEIADCTDSIALEFNSYNIDDKSHTTETIPKSYTNLIYKIDTLLEVVTDFRTRLLLEIEHYEQQQRLEALETADEADSNNDDKRTNDSESRPTRSSRFRSLPGIRIYRKVVDGVRHRLAKMARN